MSVGDCDQIERKLDHELGVRKPWGLVRHSHKWDKRMKHRRERFKARRNPECDVGYRRYAGWEW